jgi:hypothetical protein
MAFTATTGLRHDAKVWLWLLPAARVHQSCFVVIYRAGDDDILTLSPVGGRRDAMSRGDALRILSVAVFALTSSFEVAVLASWAASTFRRLNLPIYAAWLNQQLESRTRATVLSMGTTSGQIAGGPAVGALAVTPIRAALLVTAFVLTPALLLYLRAARQSRFKLAEVL